MKFVTGCQGVEKIYESSFVDNENKGSFTRAISNCDFAMRFYAREAYPQKAWEFDIWVW